MCVDKLMARIDIDNYNKLHAVCVFVVTRHVAKQETHLAL